MWGKGNLGKKTCTCKGPGAGASWESRGAKGATLENSTSEQAWLECGRKGQQGQAPESIRKGSPSRGKNAEEPDPAYTEQRVSYQPH